MPWQKSFFSALILVLAFPAIIWANGLNLNGLGTRALSMGGAFTAVADDFSAIFWNPAGAARFRRATAGLQIFDLIPKTTYRYTAYGIDAKSEPAHVLGGLAAFCLPVSSRFVVGFGISTPSGMGGEWNREGLAPFSDGILYKWATGIGVVSLSPLAAFKISEVISVGATLNFNYAMSTMSTAAGVYELPEKPGIYVDLGQYDESMSGWGVGATCGILVTPGEMFRFGLTVKAPFSLKFKGKGITTNLPLYGHPGTSEAERTFTWPLCISGGLAVRPLSQLLISADVQWSQWSTLDRNVTIYKDPYQAQLWKAAGIDDILLAWEDKIQFRFGAEYALGQSLALRAGYGYDPAPSPDKTINILLPSYTYNTFTFGVSYKIAKLRIDAGLEYMAGKDRIIAYSGYNYPGTYTMRMIIPSISVNYQF